MFFDCKRMSEISVFMLRKQLNVKQKGKFPSNAFEKVINQKWFYTQGAILLLGSSHTKEITKYLLIKWMTWVFLVCNMLLWINYPIPEWLQSEYVQSDHFLLNTYKSMTVLLRAQSVTVVKVTSVQQKNSRQFHHQLPFISIKPLLQNYIKHDENGLAYVLYTM